MAIEAFDLAEQLQTPVFVMSDLDLGMNNWMSEPFAYPEKPLQRGKVLSAEELTKLGSFARYKDVDGDGVGYRTLPGTDHPAAAYFTRGTSHNEKTAYSERPDDYIVNVERLARKYETARSMMPRPEVVQTGQSKIGLIAFGSGGWFGEDRWGHAARWSSSGGRDVAPFAATTTWQRVRAPADRFGKSEKNRLGEVSRAPWRRSRPWRPPCPFDRKAVCQIQSAPRQSSVDPC